MRGVALIAALSVQAASAMEKPPPLEVIERSREIPAQANPAEAEGFAPLWLRKPSTESSFVKIPDAVSSPMTAAATVYHEVPLPPPCLITTVAGGDSEAPLKNPQGLTFDKDGDLYIVDTGHHRVQKMDRKGIITTVAGNGTAGFSGDDGPAENASLNEPRAVAFDSDGNFYIADGLNHRIRKVDSRGVITTVAEISERAGPTYPPREGKGGGLGGNPNLPIGVGGSSPGGGETNRGTVAPGGGGPGGGVFTSSPKNIVQGVAVDAGGHLYFSAPLDAHVWTKTVVFHGPVLIGVDENGNPKIPGEQAKYAGDFVGFNGDGGPAAQAWLNKPSGLALDSKGQLTIADTANNRIRRIGPNGVIETIAGGEKADYSGSCGSATAATLDHPEAVAVDKNGIVYIADTGNNRIRRIDAEGIITTIAGNGRDYFSGEEGNSLEVAINGPKGVAVDPAGDVYIADTGNDRIRKIACPKAPEPSGLNFTQPRFQKPSSDGDFQAQAPLQAEQGAGKSSFFNSLFSGTPKNAQLTTAASTPAPYNEMAAELPPLILPISFSVRIGAESEGAQAPLCKANVIAGGAYGKLKDGDLATKGQMGAYGVAVGPDGVLYVADSLGHRIWKVDKNGAATMIAGNGQAGFSGDSGPANQAQLNYPQGVALDKEGRLLVADTQNNRVRMVDSQMGVISTVAGSGNKDLGDDGPATDAGLRHPTGVAVDSAGNILIADKDNGLIRKVDAKDHVITTLAGNPNAKTLEGDGGPADQADIGIPTAVAVDGQDNIYITHGRRSYHGGQFFQEVGFIRKIDAGNQTISTVAGALNPLGLGDGGPALNARLANPVSVSVDAEGNIYIADDGDINSVGDDRTHRIRKVNAKDGVISTIAGTGLQAYPRVSLGGDPSLLKLNHPIGVAVDDEGGLYVADIGYALSARYDDSMVFKIECASLGGGKGPIHAFRNDLFSGEDIEFVATITNNMQEAVSVSTYPLTTIKLTDQAIETNVKNGTPFLVSEVRAHFPYDPERVSADSMVTLPPGGHVDVPFYGVNDCHGFDYRWVEHCLADSPIPPGCRSFDISKTGDYRLYFSYSYDGPDEKSDDEGNAQKMPNVFRGILLSQEVTVHVIP